MLHPWLYLYQLMPDGLSLEKRRILYRSGGLNHPAYVIHSAIPHVMTRVSTCITYIRSLTTLSRMSSTALTAPWRRRPHLRWIPPILKTQNSRALTWFRIDRSLIIRLLQLSDTFNRIWWHRIARKILRSPSRPGLLTLTLITILVLLSLSVLQILSISLDARNIHTIEQSGCGAFINQVRPKSYDKPIHLITHFSHNLGGIPCQGIKLETILLHTHIPLFKRQEPVYPCLMNLYWQVMTQEIPWELFP